MASKPHPLSSLARGLRSDDGDEALLYDTVTDGEYLKRSGNTIVSGTGGSGAPTNAQYVTLATDATLSAERVLTGTSGKITITDNGAGSTVVVNVGADVVTTGSAGAEALGAGFIFGDGSDGNATIAGSSTISKDTLYDDLTISATGDLDLSGYRIFVRGTLTIEAGGRIHRNGNNASGSTNGALVAGGSVPGGAAGAAGRATTGAGGNGTGTTNSTGGSGGAGGISGAGQNGGTAGSAVVPVADSGTFRSISCALTGRIVSYTTNSTQINGGAGGAAGGCSTAGGASTSGGGGGGAGHCVIFARYINNAGTISANGGNGGAASGTAAGGGGGGGGGTVFLVYQSLTNTGTISASKGTGGAGAGTGANGNNGVDGNVVYLGNP